MKPLFLLQSKRKLLYSKSKHSIQKDSQSGYCCGWKSVDLHFGSGADAFLVGGSSRDTAVRGGDWEGRMREKKRGRGWRGGWMDGGHLPHFTSPCWQTQAADLCFWGSLFTFSGFSLFTATAWMPTILPLIFVFWFEERRKCFDRDGSGYQNGWIFGKKSNGLWPPALISQTKPSKMVAYMHIYHASRHEGKVVWNTCTWFPEKGILGKLREGINKIWGLAFCCPRGFF